jgi:hypothetical protein
MRLRTELCRRMDRQAGAKTKPSIMAARLPTGSPTYAVEGFYISGVMVVCPEHDLFTWQYLFSPCHQLSCVG